MPWIFSYGLGTDPEQMRADVGSWRRMVPATLPDHVYTFTGFHPDFDGATSTLVPLPGGVVLGVAYEVDDGKLDELREHGHGYVLRRNLARIDGDEVSVYTLQPETLAEPGRPSDEYVGRVRRGLERHYPREAVEMYLARALRRATGDGLAPARTPTPASFTHEYGCDFRRLFPWEATRERPFGSAWAVVAPGTSTTPHAHDEEETFIFLSGQGTMSVDGQQFPVAKGDAVYLEPYSAHTVRNTGQDPLELLCVWWGGVPATAQAAEPAGAAAAA
jgi:mannose-6-phosphate isomerase-like protein (cupin superfamily)